MCTSPVFVRKMRGRVLTPVSAGGFHSYIYAPVTFDT